MAAEPTALSGADSIGDDEPATADSQAAGAGNDGLVLPLTRDQVVDQALATVVHIHNQPLSAQVQVYADVHQTLQGRLADLDG
ncbi:MAG: hypothetical protein ACRC35_13870 [Angustibacter sp.]